MKTILEEECKENFLMSISPLNIFNKIHMSDREVFWSPAGMNRLTLSGFSVHLKDKGEIDILLVP